MSRVEAQLQAMPWARLLALKAVAGALTIARIDAEIDRRVRAGRALE